MPRALWSGTISFGLVNVPVQLFSAVKEHKLHFKDELIEALTEAA
jgi:DNA end-binding protein Ku